AGVLAVQGRLREVFRTLIERALLKTLLLSTALIATNWGLFIWAVSENRVTEASLGYYINPLLNVVLARIFLGERLKGLQLAAVGLAGCAVVYLTIAQGTLPWVSLVLAATFSLYGLVRKRAPIGPLVGLTVESGLAAPIAIVYLLLLDPPLANMVTAPAATRALLAGAGVITALPLLAFAAAAHRLRYTTLGMVQYLAPSLQLACAVLLYGEPFRREQVITFALIWVAVALYIAEAARTRTRG
nr:EamA family transporter RarD [Polyangiaceae bacterium]